MNLFILFYFRGVLTDIHPHTWLRAPGSLEGLAMAENIMEHIAKELSLDPLSVRMANMRPDSVMRNILPEFLDQCKFQSRKELVDIFNAANRWKKRGIAFVPMRFFVKTDKRFAVLVSVYAVDGSVRVCHGGIEMGQGINTKIAQIAARSFGIPVDTVKIEAPNTFVNANGMTTGGTQTTDAVGKVSN